MRSFVSKEVCFSLFYLFFFCVTKEKRLMYLTSVSRASSKSFVSSCTSRRRKEKFKSSLSPFQIPFMSSLLRCFPYSLSYERIFFRNEAKLRAARKMIILCKQLFRLFIIHQFRHVNKFCWFVARDEIEEDKFFFHFMPFLLWYSKGDTWCWN